MLSVVVLLQIGKGDVLLLQNMSKHRHQSSVARHVLQQLEVVKILEQDEDFG